MLLHALSSTHINIGNNYSSTGLTVDALAAEFQIFQLLMTKAKAKMAVGTQR